MKTWFICNHHLAYIDCKGNTIHPSASSISEMIQTTELENIQQSLPEISFSNLCPFIRCSFSFDQNIKGILLSLTTEHRGNQVPLDIVNGKIIDHIVIKNRWFFLGTTPTILDEMLEKAKIVDYGIIPFDSYLVLIRELKYHKEIDYYDSVSPQDILQISREVPQIPSNLTATLYPYQNAGFEWMVKTISIAHGFLLGDEMGLGKTIQIITLLLFYSNREKIHALIVSPVSLLENWEREIHKFAPSLNCMIHSGAQRTGLYKNLLVPDIVITSYGTAIQDLSMLKMINWDFLVLDEGQNIKNPESERSILLKQVPRRNSIIMSGTPFENHLTDIWSIYDFIYPGLLGELDTFNNTFSDDIQAAKQLEPIISPLMIRRKINDVKKDLPEKIIENQRLHMSDFEIQLYEQIRMSSVAAKESLGTLVKLRMACSHPFLIDDSLSGDPVDYSIKYSRLVEIVEEIIENNEKIIIFTTFKKMNELISKDLRLRFGLFTASIDGSTCNRQEIVDDFSKHSGSAILIVNPKAGGTGLNITAANHVIHYNLEWNPALEDQASARSYRTGQKQTVIIHRLIYSDTIEDYIDELMEKKRSIGETVVIGSNGIEGIKPDLIKALLKTPRRKNNE